MYIHRYPHSLWCCYNILQWSKIPPLLPPPFSSAETPATDERQVRTKTCKCQGCEKIPSYGYPCKSREYCKSHALEGMVYSAGRRCRFRGCCAPGAFNYPGYARGGSFCNDHKEV